MERTKDFITTDFGIVAYFKTIGIGIEPLPYINDANVQKTKFLVKTLQDEGEFKEQWLKGELRVDPNKYLQNYFDVRELAKNVSKPKYNK